MQSRHSMRMLGSLHSLQESSSIEPDPEELLRQLICGKRNPSNTKNRTARQEMRSKRIILTGILLVTIGLLSGCMKEPQRPEGTLSVSELLEEPTYDVEVSIYGQVSLLGELFCPCFELTSGGGKVLVWYGLMVENDGAEKPAVSVEGVQNGDQVIVTGELKTAGVHSSLNDFWASKIEKAE